MAFDLPVQPVNPKTSRRERLEILKQYYLRILVEDPLEGTQFDCAVLDKIKEIKDREEDEPLKHDPQEDDPELGPIIKETAEEAKRKIYEKYGLKGSEYRPGIGHEMWTEQKRILKEKGIDWKSPKEMNPYIIFD